MLLKSLKTPLVQFAWLFHFAAWSKSLKKSFQVIICIGLRVQMGYKLKICSFWRVCNIFLQVPSGSLKIKLYTIRNRIIWMLAPQLMTLLILSHSIACEVHNSFCIKIELCFVCFQVFWPWDSWPIKPEISLNKLSLYKWTFNGSLKCRLSILHSQQKNMNLLVVKHRMLSLKWSAYIIGSCHSDQPSGEIKIVYLHDLHDRGYLRFTLSNATAIPKSFMKRAHLVQSVSYKKDHYSPHMFINAVWFQTTTKIMNVKSVPHVVYKDGLCWQSLMFLNIASSSPRQCHLKT